MLCIAILWVFFKHLLLLSLIRVNFVVLCQDIVFYIRSVPFLDWWLEAWWDIICKLVSWDSTLSGSALNLQLLLLCSAYLWVFRHILALLRHLFTLLAHSSVVILFLLFWFLTHLRRLRVITRWTCRILNVLCRLSWLVCLIDVSITEDFLVTWIILVLIELALVSRRCLLFLVKSIVDTSAQFA